MSSNTRLRLDRRLWDCAVSLPISGGLKRNLTRPQHRPDILEYAYALARQNDGAPGVDGVTFETVEAAGVEGRLAALREELVPSPRIATAPPTRRRAAMVSCHNLVANLKLSAESYCSSW